MSFSSVFQSCLTLCNPMDCSVPGFSVHHQFLEPTKTHVHPVGDANPNISSSVVPFSSHLQSFPASESFPVSWFFASGDQITWVSASASVLPMNIQNWFPLRLTDLVSLQSKGLLVEINFAQLKFQQKVMTKVNEDFKISWKFPWLLEIIMV